jgi:hypothetical protein
MDTCEFTYIAKATELIRTAKGVEQSWDVLCAKFDREGPGLPGGTHYCTTSIEGPQLFAVDASGANVYYHDMGKWHRYITASNIKFGTMMDDGMGCPPRASA